MEYTEVGGKLDERERVGVLSGPRWASRDGYIFQIIGSDFESIGRQLVGGVREPWESAEDMCLADKDNGKVRSHPKGIGDIL